MRPPRHALLRTLAVTAAAATTAVLLPVSPASAVIPTDRSVRVEQQCFEPAPDIATSARGGQVQDTRSVSRSEQRAIQRRTDRILDRTSARRQRAAVAAPVPVYVHVMLAKNGDGDVTATQITQQIAELNQDFAGGESASAANTGFTFTLAGTDRFRNDTWHRDGASTSYRKQTRQGGANALNIWLVDFNYLGIATFPWDYAKNPGIDGIRVQYTSLPGGTATNYALGKTATHEAGHWFGLYHTFQGGCTDPNDGVSDTPAQSSPTTGCPAGRDSCPTLPGLDPIYNYMDYSYDACYNQFTPGQSTRTNQMFAAYRG